MLGTTRFEKTPLFFDGLRIILGHVRRNDEVAPFAQGTQTRRFGNQGVVLHAVFAYGRCKPCRIDAQQDLVGLDHIAFAHHDLLDHPTVKALQDLQLTRRDDLSFATRHFVDPTHRRPHHPNCDSNSDRAQQDACPQGFLLQDSVIGIGLETTLLPLFLSHRHA